MTIENLAMAVPPPAEPFDAFQGPWAAIETAVGTKLPFDFKEFAQRYGTGSFMDFIFIPVPSLSDRGVTYARRVGEVCRGFRVLSLPYPVWPDAGGLFPVGATENGDFIFWLARGRPESWKVVVWDRGGVVDEELEIFDCDLTDFLAKLATRKIAPRAFPHDLLPGDDLFRPGKD